MITVTTKLFRHIKQKTITQDRISNLPHRLS